MTRRFPVTNQPDDQEGGITYSVGFELNQFQGTTLVVGDTVFLSDEGVEVLASTDGSYYAVNAYSFIDSDRDEIGGLYGRDDTGQNLVGLRVVDEAEKGDDTHLQIVSSAQVGAQGKVTLLAEQDGGDYVTLILQQSDSTSRITMLANDYLMLGRKILMLGASNELCDMYVTGTYFVLRYNTGAQYYYKYIDLSDTSPSWQHSTSEP
jgi:hypothetical protein